MGQKSSKKSAATINAAPQAKEKPLQNPSGSGPLRRFFAPEDWIAAGATFLISGAVFLYYMSPSITLQDSGELVTGAFNFGVPHPPGYPLWTFLGWVWSHLVPFGNPAWRICLMSVLTGALLVGIMTLLMTRSILMLLRASPWAEKIEEPMKHWIALTVGSCASLLFAFNRGVWLWACVPEMRVLNVFMFVITACTFFAWMMRPEQHKFLYATILLYGLGITNHQTIAVMVVPFLIGALVVSPKTFWELTVAALLSATAGFIVLAWLHTTTFAQMVNHAWWWRAMGVGAVGVVMLIAFGANGWLDRKRALICAGLFLLACCFYLYMPLAASTNPPMNWGYTATKQGFLHTITRGQYQRINFAVPWSKEFFIQMRLFMEALFGQFSVWLSLLPLVTMAAWASLKKHARSWLIFVWVAYLTTFLGLLTIINPALEKQHQEINIKFFAPAHGFFAMLIGYGIALALGWALACWEKLPRVAVRVGCVALLALPLIPYTRNWAVCEQRNHDFGYQFGYRMFYPGDPYPPMERDAVLFGGTDPGRFVPTYMIFCESFAKPHQKFRDPYFDRRDVYIITQNALADSTYMSYIRDHYDYSRPKNDKFLQRLLGRDKMYPPEPIYIPTETDLQRAFQEYVASLQGRPLGPEEQVEIVGGAVSVKGVAGVMAINGILTRWIHERNKHKHAFYVEESYPIPWMYEYLEPFGVIMKINREPLPSPKEAPELWAQIVARDREYWDRLCAEFLARPEFHRDSDAQKTFSKQRSAIGGVYAWRKMHAEAEYAYKQALQLSPESPEANFRLAQMYVELNRFDDAVAVLSALQKLDPLNKKIQQGIEQVQAIQQASYELTRLEMLRATNPRDVQLVIQLAQAYARYGRLDKVTPLFDSYLAQPDLGFADMMRIAELYLQINQLDRCVAALQLIISRFPNEGAAYYGLALTRALQFSTEPALDALEKAIELSPQLRENARTDARLNHLRGSPRFHRIIAPPPAS
jgi:tetratricopeptide (TPR) repeat protein